MTHNSTKSQCFYFRFLMTFLMWGFKINWTEYNFKIFRPFSLGYLYVNNKLRFRPPKKYKTWNEFFTILIVLNKVVLRLAT
jgi:hypothetical protein